MKIPILSRLLLICGLWVTLSTARAQYVAIPDTAFGTWLDTSGYGACMTGSAAVGWQLDTTCSAVLNAVSLHLPLYGYGVNGMSDLSGVNFFKHLDTLICAGNSITNLGQLPDSLIYLDCSSNSLSSLPNLTGSMNSLICTYNQLTVLPAMPSSLENLNCSENQLASLPVLPASLQYLYCSNNLIAGLPSLPDSLYLLGCDYNLLSSLPALPASLIALSCASNQITSLPTLPHLLNSLVCNNNLLTALPSLPDTLNELNCAFNQLTSLPTLPNWLGELDCYGNQLLSLPALNSYLDILKCYSNQLTGLPTLPASLQELDCSDNPLTTLPALPAGLFELYCHNSALASLPALPQALQYLDVTDDSSLYCLPVITSNMPMQEFQICSTNISCLPNPVTANTTCYPFSYPLCDSASGCPYTLGIAELTNDNIKLYPNPNNGTFTLSTTGSTGCSYAISDMMGDILRQEGIRSAAQAIDMSDASPGVYALSVRGAQPIRFVIFK